jgi:phage shock protein A
MSESLKNRVSRVIAGGVHALLDRLEDQAPEAMMEQSIREAGSVIDEVRHELGQVAANRHLAQQQHASLNTQHSNLSAQIELAFGQGREELARAAVARQLDIEAQLPVLETTLAEQARQEVELQGYVAALLAKQREMQDALAEFRKSRAAQASSTAPGLAGAAGGARAEQRMAGVTGAFDRLYTRQTGLSSGSTATDLAQGAQLKQLEDLMRDQQIAQRLAQLKAGRGS